MRHLLHAHAAIPHARRPLLGLCRPHSKATVASRSPPTDPQEPHGSLLFHCSPSAGASRWPLLLCNMHMRLLWVSVTGSWGTGHTHTTSFLPWVLKTCHFLVISQELLPDGMALEAAELRDSSCEDCALRDGGFLRTLGGPLEPRKWKSCNIRQSQQSSLRTARKDTKEGLGPWLCGGRSWDSRAHSCFWLPREFWGGGHG